MAADFRQERKWKIAMAKKIAFAVVKFHSQKQQKAERADRSVSFLIVCTMQRIVTCRTILS